MRGTVHALFITPEKKAKSIALDLVRAGSAGFEGDFHSTAANGRQILMLSNSVLSEFGLAAGSLYENMVVEGIDVMKLEPKQQLHIGDAVLEVTVPCEPCMQM